MSDRPTPRLRRRTRALTIVAVLAASVLSPAAGTPATADSTTVSAIAGLVAEGWVWPVREFRVERAFEAPAHDYGPGHRGIDLRPVASLLVRAPSRGVVAFAGRVADRGVVTIDHGDGLVTTLEPIESDIAVGTVVEEGAPLGSVGGGGHAAAGALHFGLRLHGEYINPMLLLGGVPRAVLLPCC